MRRTEFLETRRGQLALLRRRRRERLYLTVDPHQPNEIELVQFGLLPEFIGQGLGKWFLQWTIDKAWSYQPDRFWLHTCTLDHPAALPLYRKAGFVQYEQRTFCREL